MAVSIKVIRDAYVQAKQNYEESNNIAAYTDFLTTYSDEALAKPFINSINEVLSNKTKPKIYFLMNRWVVGGLKAAKSTKIWAK